jgi:YD repeat-containing protein
LPLNFDKNKTETGWTHSERIIPLTKDYKSYVVYAQYGGTAGTVWFDDVAVIQTSANTAMLSRYNLAENAGFEKGIGSAVQSWGVNNVSSGAMSVTKTTLSGNTFIANPTKETLKPGVTYTFSVMVKSEKAPNSTATVKFDFYDSSNNLLYSYYDGANTVVGSSSWKRVYISLTEAQAKAKNSAVAMIQPVIVAGNVPDGGFVYFDNARFEEGAIVSKSTYDTYGNKLTQSDTEGKKTTYTYDDRGNLESVTGPNTTNPDLKLQHNELDEVKFVNYNSSGLTLNNEYDFNGNLLETVFTGTSGDNLIKNKKMTYDELDRIKSIEDQLQNITTYWKWNMMFLTGCKKFCILKKIIRLHINMI